MERGIIEIEKWISPYKWEFYYDEKSGVMAINGTPFEDLKQKWIHYSTFILDKVKRPMFFIYDTIGELKEIEFKYLDDFLEFTIEILVKLDSDKISEEYMKKLKDIAKNGKI